MPVTNIIYNDNQVFVQWFKQSTTKGLRHIHMWESQVRENVESHFVTIQRVDGKIYFADIFTKDMKDMSYLWFARSLHVSSIGYLVIHGLLSSF
jgi:hypothetical protein